MKNIIFDTSFLLISLLYEIDGSIFYNHEHGTNFQKIKAKDDRPYQQVSSRFGRATSDKIPRFFEETLPGDESEAYVHWSGNKSDTVYVLTRHPDVDNNITHSTLWRSSDYGKTFVSQSENVPVLQNALISFFYVSPTNKDKLVFADVTNSCVYVTTDDGVSYTKMPTPVEPSRILFHPTLEDTLLFYSEIQLELYKTDNLFTSHSHVCSDVTEKFYWDSTKGSTTVHLQVMDSTILRYYYKVCNTSTTTTDPQHCMSSMNIDLGFTDIDEDSLIVAGDYILVQKSTLTTSELFVKYKSLPFKRAYFPLDVHPQNFNILNTDYNQIFIATDHWQQTVDLYVSDVTGQFYVKSLSHVLNLKDGRGFVPDIYEVRGTPGVYVANHVAADASRTRTMISYDQGARWQPLAAPKSDAQGNPTNCKLPECGLHLHMHYSSVMYGNSDILSEANAPGYIMAEGFMGESLDSTSTTLFFSSDNGVTWKALFDGDHYYSIMDHGSAIVVIERSYQETTKTMKYSCTEGEHWVDYDFLNHEMMVYGLLTEPGITTLIVSVYGKATETTGWTVSTVNFQPVLDRECTPEDYITWSPVNGTCLLGQKFTYHRRIASKACHNGEDYIRPFQVVRCPCSEIDFECDYGYINNGQECTTAPWYNSSHPVGTCPEGERYLNSSGYREIASDNCTKDWSDPKYAKYKPHNSTCPMQAPGGLVLRLSGDKQTLVAGRREVIILEQHQGSKRNTKYKWSFGNQTETDWIIGFLDGQHQHLHYLEPGRYKLSVIAKNTAGKETVQMYISVENLLSGLYFDAPRVAKKDCSEMFQVVPLTNDLKIFYQSSLHYAWDFGDYSADFLDSHIATYSASVKYTYHTAGNFTIYVSAVNDVDQIHEAIEITVFDDLKRVQLTFDSKGFNTRLDTVPWRLMFANKVKALLTEYDALNIPPSRLDVVVPEALPLSAEVSILPASSFGVEGEEDVTVLSTKLMELCGKGLVIDVGSYMEIKCQSASEMDLSDDGSKQNFIAVYVCVPILVAAVFVSVLIVFYYKRKFTSVRRYQSQRNQLDDNDHLLDNTDDDDVEPLDPNPDRLLDDHTMQRTTNSRPTLVMMSSNIDDEDTSSNNAVDC